MKGFLIALTLFPAILVAEAVHQFPLDLEIDVETTPLENGETFEFLFESFGKTRLQILAKYAGDALKEKEFTGIKVVALSESARIAPLTSSPSGQSNNGYLKHDILLASPGVYRIIPAAKHTLFRARCLANCGRLEIPLSDAIKGMNDAELGMVSDKIAALFGSSIPNNPAVREAIKSLRDRLVKRDPTLGDRFPLLPDIATLDSWRPLLTFMNQGTATAAAVAADKNLVWEERLAHFRKQPLPQPEEIDAKTPHIRYGHFLGGTLPAEMAAQNQALAEVLTGLSLKKDYSVEFPSGPRATENVNSVGALLDLLWDSGHHIQLHDERTFANFLAFTWHDKYIRWPAWFRTGLYLQPKEELLFPLPHSQFVFQVRGPRINARVNFYLGMTGAAFFPRWEDQRPQWTGFASTAALSDSVEGQKPLIREAFRTAEVYLRRNKLEYPRFAAKYPADGYGYLGVCNDSSAVIERAVFNKSTFYPLFRSAELAELSRGNDGLDPVFEALPNDSLPLGMLKGGPGSREEVLARLHAMTAYPYDPSFRWDRSLYHQLSRSGKHRP